MSIYWYLDGTGIWNPSSWNTETCLTFMTKIWKKRKNTITKFKIYRKVFRNCIQKNCIILCFIHSNLSTDPINSLAYGDINSFWSKLIQIMAWCLMAPSHYLNQCWLIITDVLLHSVQFYRNILKTPITKMCLKIFIFKITSRASMTQWVNWKPAWMVELELYFNCYVYFCEMCGCHIMYFAIVKM